MKGMARSPTPEEGMAPNDTGNEASDDASEDTPQPELATIELRGRDLAVVPPTAWWLLDDQALYTALFGSTGAAAASALLTRDRRGRCLRARPLDFARITAALSSHGACVVHITFDQHPLLPEQAAVRLPPRPYQEEALLAWRAAGCRGVVVLPTGGGKTLVGALALADMGLWTLVVVPTLDLLRQWRAALVELLGWEASGIG